MPYKNPLQMKRSTGAFDQKTSDKQQANPGEMSFSSRYTGTRYNKVPREWQNVFVILGFFSIHFTITGLKNMVHYTGVFVI